ncbi:Pre-mRNA-splicing factor 38 [Spatholobus suberectus]|nr:Pre-mRNA-splicing factor 38 [Spatholobus suberectus]
MSDYPHPSLRSSLTPHPLKELNQLQTLCKKNKILAHITKVMVSTVVGTCSMRNLVMDAFKLEMFVDVLPDMPKILGTFNKKWVEGLDDFLNPRKGDIGTPNVHHHTLMEELKQLQTLYKKNKILANITNLCLNQVEGLDEFLNPREGDAGTPNTHHLLRILLVVFIPLSLKLNWGTLDSRGLLEPRRSALEEDFEEEEEKEDNDQLVDELEDRAYKKMHPSWRCLWMSFQYAQNSRHVQQEMEFTLTHVDGVIDELLTKDYSCDIALPRVKKRMGLKGFFRVASSKTSRNTQSSSSFRLRLKDFFKERKHERTSFHLRR